MQVGKNASYAVTLFLDIFKSHDGFKVAKERRCFPFIDMTLIFCFEIFFYYNEIRKARKFEKNEETERRNKETEE